MDFNYYRNILPVPKVTVPRIIFPKKLPKHTTYVISQVDIGDLSLPFLVAKHKMKGLGRWVYVHRMNNSAILIGKYENTE